MVRMHCVANDSCGDFNAVGPWFSMRQLMPTQKTCTKIIKVTREER